MTEETELLRRAIIEARDLLRYRHRNSDTDADVSSALHILDAAVSADDIPTDHSVEAIFGEDHIDWPQGCWKVICACGWECWYQPSREVAQRQHDIHIAAVSDPLSGLPPDLARVLRDPAIVIPQDAAVFEAVANTPLFETVLAWMNAKSNTASAEVSHEDS
jgi:hypothetical protein